MKNVKYLFLFMAILFLPFVVFADEEASSDESKEAIIYFFRGEGCSHCAEAEEWFKSIEDEYGERFTIKDYETWYDEDNAELMKKVAKARGEEDQATGVPYIIIGDKSWIGFADEYKDEIKEQIDKVYGQDVSERYDILKYVKSGKSAKKEEKSNSSDVVALLCMIVVCGLIIFGIYKARKNTN